MPVRTITKGHKAAILTELQNARFSIYACVAWFTDKDVFDCLCLKALEGLDVQLILREESKDEKKINVNGAIDLSRFISCRGKLYFLPNNHNKYCIIDLRHFIIGSLNWTYNGFKNSEGNETIVIHKDEPELCYQSAINFKKSVEVAISPPTIISETYSKQRIVNISQLDDKVVKLSLENGATIYTTFNTIASEVNSLVGEVGKAIYSGESMTVTKFLDMRWLIPINRNNRIFLDNSLIAKKAEVIVNDLSDDLPF